jgi:WD40 repeat protein
MEPYYDAGNLDTERQIAPPTETGHFCVNTVKYSPQLEENKFVSGGIEYMIPVWSKDGKLPIKMERHDVKHIAQGRCTHLLRINGNRLIAPSKNGW